MGETLSDVVSRVVSARKPPTATDDLDGFCPALPLVPEPVGAAQGGAARGMTLRPEVLPGRVGPAEIALVGALGHGALPERFRSVDAEGGRPVGSWRSALADRAEADGAADP